MESYVLKRNEELCSQLAMNFDEANELFGNETLSSMQMVQVNGGDFWTTVRTIAAKTISITAQLAVEIYQALVDSHSATFTEIQIDNFGRYRRITGNEIEYNDSIIIKNPDGSIEARYESIKIK